VKELLRAFWALPSRVRSDLRRGVDASDSPSRRMRRNFVYHLHPLKVTERALAPTTTFALGLVTLTLFLTTAVTGGLLMLYYVPTPEGAYASILDIEHLVTLGEPLRLMHRFAAHLMVVTVALHLLRIVAMGAYRCREINWLFGLSLLALVLALAFSGYLLPWDQTSYWAVRVVTNMLDHMPLFGVMAKPLLLGGSEVGGATLLRFYAMHVAVLPAFLVAFAVLHLWRIRRDGGLAYAGEASTVPAWPHLVLREGVIVLVVVGLLALWTLLIDSPLAPPADPMRPSNPEKAPWYFVGFQEMVSYSAVIGGFIFPGFFALLLLALPFLDRDDDAVGGWFASSAERLRLVVVAALTAAVVVAAVWMCAHPALAVLETWTQELVNPVTLSLALCLIAFAWVSNGSGLRSGLRAALAVLVVSLLVFTVVGICRGPDWAFFWPWEEYPGGI